MKIRKSNLFCGIQDDDKSNVFEIIPDIISDNRGSFSEVLKDYGNWNEKSNYPLWFSNLNWIRQVNRSKNKPGVIRGCHAQQGVFCQAKLVESLNNVIYDIITDCRPNSGSFGVSGIFKLDPIIQNKLFIPRGFIHSFVVPLDSSNKESIFNYYCDNIYNKESEICINPKSIIPKIVDIVKDNIDQMLYNTVMTKETIYSEKDCNGLDYEEFMIKIQTDFSNSGKLWYK